MEFCEIVYLYFRALSLHSLSLFVIVILTIYIWRRQYQAASGILYTSGSQPFLTQGPLVKFGLGS